MRRLALLVAIAALGVAGCSGAPAEVKAQDTRHAPLLDAPAAMYCLASAREYDEYATDLESEIREQKRLVGELRARAQWVMGEAGRIRFDLLLPPNVREAEALNLEGEGKRMREEIQNRQKLIGVLEGRAAWYSGRAHREDRRIDQIMHGDTPAR